MQIYVHRNNQQLGPFTEADIKAQLAAGTITLQDHVWWQGQASWLPLGQTSLVGPIAPPTPGMPAIPHPATAIPPTGAFPTTAQTSQLAIWSLVCACLTFVCGIFTLVPAIIMGHMSLSEIKKHPGMHGRGLAIAGLAISYVLLAICVLVIIAIVVLGALGNNVQDVFKTITSQINAAQANSGSDNDSSTNSADQTTNAPDQTTPTATPTTNSDQPTATPTTTDQSTNSATTNAAPASQ